MKWQVALWTYMFLRLDKQSISIALRASVLTYYTHQMTTMSYLAFSHLGNKRLCCSYKCTKSSKWKEHKEPERFAKMHFHSGWLLLQDCFARDEDITESIEWLMAGKGSRGRMIWLHAQPLPPPPSLKSARPATHRKAEKGRHLADGRGGGARSRIIRPRESLVPCK